MQYLRCTTYDIVGRTYDVVTYDIQEYHRYNVTYDIVGVTYNVVVTQRLICGVTVEPEPERRSPPHGVSIPELKMSTNSL